MKRLSKWMAVPLMVVAAGCSGGASSGNLKLVPAKGKVYLDDQAQKSGSVVLTPNDDAEKGLKVIYGPIAEDGTFALTTYTEGDGAAAGKYKVTLQAAAEDPKKSIMDPSKMMAQAAGISTETLEIEIPEKGDTNLDFKLKSTDKKRTTPGSANMIGK